VVGRGGRGMTGSCLGKGLPRLDPQGLLDKVPRECKILLMMKQAVSIAVRHWRHSEVNGAGFRPGSGVGQGANANCFVARN